MGKIFKIKGDIQYKKISKKHANRQHQDQTNTKQLWQQLRFSLRKGGKMLNLNSPRHCQYIESFQTCSKF